MQTLLSNLKIAVPENIYLKDPESSELGKRIIENSILLIDDIGFDIFTFKKLGEKIGSNESSIYRYFESKHKLLLYLSSWYWGWIEYQLVFETHSISNHKEKLLKAIDIVCRTIKTDNSYKHINKVALNKIIINENSKSFLTKEVDEENKNGYFVIYKRIVKRLSDIIQNTQPDYPFPESLASTILEGSLHQHFLRDHFTSITNCDQNTTTSDYFIHLTVNTLKI